MKNNAIQILILALVGFALIGGGFLLFISAGGDPTPEYSERVHNLFGCFWWVAETLDGILRGVLGAGIMWVGYKVWPFRDEKPKSEQETAPETNECLTANPIE